VPAYGWEATRIGILLWVVGGIIVLMALGRAFYTRSRDRRFKSGFKWSEAAMPMKHRLPSLAAAFVIVFALIVMRDASPT
jgi:NADH:ubiquinone oxidoreductase subunit 3 (subunit A)